MDPSLATAIGSALLGLVTGMIGTYVGAVVKFRKDLEADYDKDLRNRRIEAYKSLWKLLQFLARYDRPKPLTAPLLHELSVAMRQWYFEVGGIFVSEETRTTYFELKDLLSPYSSARYDADKCLDNEPEVQLILNKARDLRSHLTHDIGTRKSPAIKEA